MPFSSKLDSRISSRNSSKRSLECGIFTFVRWTKKTKKTIASLRAVPPSSLLRSRSVLGSGEIRYVTLISNGCEGDYPSWKRARSSLAHLTLSFALVPPAKQATLIKVYPTCSFGCDWSELYWNNTVDELI